MEKKSIAKNYAFLAIMLGAMILGAILGWVWPAESDGSGGIVSGTGATVVNTAFSLGEGLDVRMAWLGAIAYTLQIYFDFSGYSDMAIGLGTLFGFETPENFDYPYISASITEFWRRWHLSLSLWFRDYLYIPLGEDGGARPGNASTRPWSSCCAACGTGPAGPSFSGARGTGSSPPSKAPCP